MLDIKLFRDEPDKIREALRHRGEETSSVDAVRALDAERRAGLTELEALRAERNTVSKAIGQTKD